MLIASIFLLTVPPPPIVSSGSQTDIVSFAAGQVSCGGDRVASTGIVRPVATVSTRYGSAASGTPPTFRFTFAIDAQGRPTTIRRDPDGPSGFYVDASDLAPSLAASRFAAGDSRAGCSIRYGATLTPIGTASSALLYEIASRSDTAGRTIAVYDRVRPVGSTCPTTPGQYRRLNLPAFEKLPQPAGGLAWVFLAFDVDPSGKPRDALVLGSSGDEALDKAGVAALMANRYAPGPGYRGCTYHFFHNVSADRPSPPLPPDTPRDNGDEPGCRVDPKSISSLLNGNAYPAPFSRRRIEGVAVIGYDTAPWGATGDVKIILSEPAEAFGEAARSAFASARVAQSEAGRRGCVQRVRFKLSARQSAGPEG